MMLGNRVLQTVKIRPLIPFFWVTVIFSAIYALYFFKYPGLEERGYEKDLLTGTVNQKEYNSDGSLKNLVVEDVFVYPKDDYKLTDIVIGSEVVIKGSIFEIEPPMNRGEFDFKYYNAVRGRFFQVKAERIEVLSAPKNSFGETISALKQRAFIRLTQYCPLEYGTVATLAFADKRGISIERKQLYQRAGCAHFLVISGLHVSVFGGMLYRLFRRIFGIGPAASVLTLTVLLIYGAFAGFGVSVIRAVIMFSVRLLADILKENYDMLNAVMLAACITLAGNPLYVFDSSFIYSYAAVISIALYLNVSGLNQDEAETYVKKLISLLKLPCVILVAMLPVTLYLSYEYSLLSIAANLVLMPMSVPVLLLSVLALFFSLYGLSVPAATADFFLALMLRGFDWVCGMLVKIPGTVLTGRPKIWQLAIYYALVLVFLALLHKEAGAVIKLMYYVSLLAFVTTPLLFRGYMSMLYVGQGECIVIRTGSRSAILIDAGSTSEPDMYASRLLPFLKAEGIVKIEAAFASHGDADHANGLKELIEDDSSGIQIKRLVCSWRGLKTDSGLKALVKSAGDKNIKTDLLKAGDLAKCGMWRFLCLSPGIDDGYEDSNDASLVMYVENNEGFSALFTGDAGEKVEQDISRLPLGVRDIFLLKAAHHGSKYSTSEDLLRRFSFEYAIISAGRNNIYGHPHRDTLDRLEKYNIKTVITKEAGEIDIYTE